jgi:hypothetical protein
MHPSWYYSCFDQIFGATRDYVGEIAIISGRSPLYDREVEEIGVGLGGHLKEVLKCRPRTAVGVDIDADACRHATERFSLDSRVSIVHADGFKRRSNASLAYCFYCVPQQSYSVLEAVDRLRHLAEHARDGREAWVEMMDVDRHLAANLHRPASEIYRNGDDYLELRTTASEVGVEIIYSGVMGSRPTEYRVPIAKIDGKTISQVASRVGASIEYFPLSSSSRRVLVRFF